MEGLAKQIYIPSHECCSDKTVSSSLCLRVLDGNFDVGNSFTHACMLQRVPSEKHI
eukprot:jgi/Antlo1/811/219